MIDLDDAVNELMRGGIVVMPTDTVYGVAVLPGYEDKIYDLKGRDRTKPLPLLAADRDDIIEFGAKLSGAEAKLADRFWPGPLTIVIETAGGTEGFRVPDHDVALDLIRKAGGILRVTSANLSGEPPALTADEAEQCLGAGVNAIVDAGRVTGGVPSTVVVLNNAGEIKILRQGALSEEQLLNVINE